MKISGKMCGKNVLSIQEIEKQYQLSDALFKNGASHQMLKGSLMKSKLQQT